MHVEGLRDYLRNVDAIEMFITDTFRRLTQYNKIKNNRNARRTHATAWS